MLSEELYIMGKNMERMMVSELQDEVNALKAERDDAEEKFQQLLAYAKAHGYQD